MKFFADIIFHAEGISTLHFVVEIPILFSDSLAAAAQ